MSKILKDSKMAGTNSADVTLTSRNMISLKTQNWMQGIKSNKPNFMILYWILKLIKMKCNSIRKRNPVSVCSSCRWTSRHQTCVHGWVSWFELSLLSGCWGAWWESAGPAGNQYHRAEPSLARSFLISVSPGCWRWKPAAVRGDCSSACGWERNMMNHIPCTSISASYWLTSVIIKIIIYNYRK